MRVTSWIYLDGSEGKPNSLRNSSWYFAFSQLLASLTCSGVKFLAKRRSASLRLASLLSTHFSEHISSQQRGSFVDATSALQTYSKQSAIATKFIPINSFISNDSASKSIGAAGFEPTTSTTPKWRATKLRYAP
jgi:hypothetical protein